MKSKSELFKVGVGASAGGLSALIDLVQNLPKGDHFFTIIIAQHVDPKYNSKLVDLLSEVAIWPVKQAIKGEALMGQVIYVVPPGFEVELKNDTIKLFKVEQSTYPSPSIDRFFNSLAANSKEYSIGVILSGTGKDGSEGVKAIKMAKGMVMAQDELEANYPSMPNEARNTGLVDVSCKVAQMGESIVKHIISFDTILKDKTAHDSVQDNILNLLKERRRTDFSQYKPSTIDRRIKSRIQELSLTDLKSYYKYIKSNSEELDNLNSNLLIGTTEFFRDEEAYDDLKNKLSNLIQINSNKIIRIWSIGCLTGEEPYSIAIILSELLGDRIKDFKIQIFATDIDEEALYLARRGCFSFDKTANVAKEYLKKYFISTESGYEVKNDLKQLILFAKHDITVDPPFVKMDFITCRNLLIYFNLDLQKAILPKFHYALNDSGYLLLGKSENSIHVEGLFVKPEENEELYQKIDNITVNTLNFDVPPKKENNYSNHVKEADPSASLNEIVNETILKTYEHSFVVLDQEMGIVLIKGSLKPFLELSEGPLNYHVLKILDKKLHNEVRTLFSEVKREKIAKKGNVLPYSFNGEKKYVQLNMKPLPFRKNGKEYFLLEFQHIVSGNIPYPEKELLNNPNFNYSLRIVELEQELAANYRHLNTFTLELERSNDEVQAINEELKSANEKLKSSNEELETSNEEL